MTAGSPGSRTSRATTSGSTAGTSSSRATSSSTSRAGRSSCMSLSGASSPQGSWSRIPTTGSGCRWTRSRTASASKNCTRTAARPGRSGIRSHAQDRSEGRHGMHALRLGADPSQPLKILLLGAHCDDIEIGCGGTVLHLLSGGPPHEIIWVVFSSDAAREREARASAAEFLRGAARSRVIVQTFRDGYIPYEGAAIKDRFEQLKGEVSPDVVFTHFGGDRHQDHRLVAELTWNTFRNHMILEYEVPK